MQSLVYFHARENRFYRRRKKNTGNFKRGWHANKHTKACEFGHFLQENKCFIFPALSMFLSVLSISCIKYNIYKCCINKFNLFFISIHEQHQ